MGKQEDDLFISWGEYELSHIALSSIIATVYERAKKLRGNPCQGSRDIL